MHYVGHLPTLLNCTDLGEDRPTLHLQHRAVLNELGLLSLAPLTNIHCFNGYTHPIHATVAGEPADSDFQLCGRKLERFYDRFRVSVSEFCALYEDLLPLLYKPITEDAIHARLSARALTPTEMIAVFIYRSDNADPELLSILFHDVSADTIRRFSYQAIN